ARSGPGVTDNRKTATMKSQRLVMSNIGEAPGWDGWDQGILGRWGWGIKPDVILTGSGEWCPAKDYCLNASGGTAFAFTRCERCNTERRPMIARRLNAPRTARWELWFFQC